jgi:hypothetical protein
MSSDRLRGPPSGFRGTSVHLTAHLHEMPKLKSHGAISPLPMRLQGMDALRIRGGATRAAVSAVSLA